MDAAQGAIFLLPLSSFLLTLLLVPLVARWAAARGYVAQPKRDRWHTRPTPMLGGVAFFLGFLAPVLWFVPDLGAALPFFIVTGMMFIVGIYDDLRELHPTKKLIGQIISAAAAIYLGYSLQFFSWAPLDALLTAVWIVGLTNALNLLDNMDGLAGGIALIAALYLAFLFGQKGNLLHLAAALALAGAVSGFLLHNFFPASIFMGDAGSMFLGASLSLLTVQANGQASNILSLVAIPACILLVPILDTALVTITRLLRGQPISQGGKDHASHRLVILGLSERQAVLLLYVMAAVAGATAVAIERFDYALSLALLPLMILSFVLFTAYLAQVEIVAGGHRPSLRPEKRLTVLLFTLAHKGRLLEIVLDFFLIAFAYYLAFALRFEFALRPALTTLYVTSFPIIVVAAYCAFCGFRIYQGLWRHTGLDDLVRLGVAVFSGTLLAVGALAILFRFEGYSKAVFILYGILLFLGMVGSRLSFRLFGHLVRKRRGAGVPVLVYGAGDGGEAVVRECLKNPAIGLCPVGFLDDDPAKEGRTVLGLRIFGGVEKLPQVLERNPVQGCIISSASILANGHVHRIRSLCRERGVWIKKLQFEFVEEGVGEL